MTPDPKILFVHNWLSSFIRYDLEILREEYSVTELPILDLSELRLVEIARQVYQHDLVFGWWASWHTFWPFTFACLLDKPSVLVIGGYDLANLPEIDYGSQRGGIRQWVSRLTMMAATQLTTFSQYNQKEAWHNAGISKNQVELIYLGVPDPFEALPDAPKQRKAMTVGVVKQNNLLRKGHQLFVDAARYLPEFELVLIGDWEDDTIEQLRHRASSNVVFTGWIERQELLRHYRQAAFYVQASRHEGFGMTVAEAMLAGCVPVVTRTGALPEVVGKHGYYFDTMKAQSVVQSIQQAQDDATLRSRQDSREWILDQFPIEKRQKSLQRLVEKTFN